MKNSGKARIAPFLYIVDGLESEEIRCRINGNQKLLCFLNVWGDWSCVVIHFEAVVAAFRSGRFDMYSHIVSLNRDAAERHLRGAATKLRSQLREQAALCRS